MSFVKTVGQFKVKCRKMYRTAVAHLIFIIKTTRYSELSSYNLLREIYRHLINVMKIVFEIHRARNNKTKVHFRPSPNIVFVNVHRKFSLHTGDQETKVDC